MKKEDVKIGMKVRIESDLKTAKDAQRGYGGWDDDMTELLGKVGVVNSVSEVCDYVGVEFDGHSYFVWSPENLTPVETTKIVKEYKVGQVFSINGHKCILSTVDEYLRFVSLDTGNYWSSAKYSYTYGQSITEELIRQLKGDEDNTIELLHDSVQEMIDGIRAEDHVQPELSIDDIKAFAIFEKSNGMRVMILPVYNSTSELFVLCGRNGNFSQPYSDPARSKKDLMDYLNDIGCITSKLTCRIE